MVHLVSKYRAIKQKRRCTPAKFNNEIRSSTILNFAFIKDLFFELLPQVGNTASESYKKIYWFSWKCFQAADADRDGQVLLHHDDDDQIWFLQASPTLFRCLATSLRR